MMKRLTRLMLAPLLLLTLPADAAGGLVIKALFRDSAVIEIDGQQKVLKTGETFAGVTLLKADSKSALVEINGERKSLAVGRQMGAAYSQPERTVVRIASQDGGHYFTPGRINNRPVNFLVDTGATTIALSSTVADKLGINYQKGETHYAHTASGVVMARRITLNSVSVGALVLHNVEASVLEGDFPRQVLLGNSYLSRVHMQVDDGVLVLQAKF